ncbi:LuxR family transcriptional regulator [Gordonia paraffinivorans]|uniref:LuxR C-terminal-related transcriptional regulator n=1 Tax=Gordonia paraffinivorans TaxID=175628 RepID=UPI001C92C2B8|nr:LuxR C-terminal-related transcriptional regulator [Gordonia paraffinivorans]MBY4573360.1 LuxR family transcriptional regulator [Gordonia paraffinivorans]
MYENELDRTVSQALTALADVAGLLDVGSHEATRGVVDAASAIEMVSALERAVGRLPASAQRRDAALTLRALRAELLAQRLTQQRHQLALLTQQLAGLRTASTLDDLVAAIPVETARLGYERVMFSWVKDECWVPTGSYTSSGPSESREILAAGGPPYYPVRYLNEVDVVRKRASILVLDARLNPRVHPTISPVSRSVTYVAAPVVARDRVAAMLHVDRNTETGLNDDYDRELVELFAQSLGVMIDRLLDAPGDRGSRPSDVDADWLAALTAREREVLELVALGLTNAQIGARLYISEHTTKTHVKSVMRKIGAANRAQAGAMYHQLRQASA